MQADFSVECGAGDECLEIPWVSEDGELRYCDLKHNPESIEQLEEVQRFPELGELLRAVNAAGSLFQSVKCDVWFTGEIAPEEEIFGAAGKFGSYVDLVFRAHASQISFERHEAVVRDMGGHLKDEPDLSASVEFVVRRCYWSAPLSEHDGFCFTCYVFGFGDDEANARRQWGVALRTLGKVLRSERDSSLRSE